MTDLSNVELIRGSTQQRRDTLKTAIRQIDYKIAILDAAMAKLKYIDLKGSANLK